MSNLSIAIDVQKTAKKADLSSFPIYKTPVEHLSDELRLLDLRLKKELLRKMKLQSSDRSETAGLFVTAEEINSTLSYGADDNENKQDNSKIEELDRLLEALEQEIRIKLSNTDDSGIILPLRKLSEIFRLSKFEQLAIIAAIAPDIDKKYERSYAYFNDDLNKKAPSVDMVIKLFLAVSEDKADARKSFSRQAALFRFNLLYFVNSHEEDGFLSRRFKVDEGIRYFIAGEDALHPALFELANFSYPAGDIQITENNKPVFSKVEKMVKSWFDNEIAGLVCWLHGKSEDSKETIVSSLGEKTGMPVITVSFEDVIGAGNKEMVLGLLLREAILRPAILFFRDGVRTCEEKDGFLIKSLLKSILDYSWFVIISADELWIPEKINPNCSWAPFEFKPPGFLERRAVWKETLLGSGISDSELDVISGRFQLSERDILSAAKHAKLSSTGDSLNLQSLLQSCCYQSVPKLNRHAHKVSSNPVWSDLVLPEDKIDHLKEICAFIRNKHLVYYRWGFERKLALGKGANMLFSGPSGTGKTMTTGIIANELNLDIYKIDLSSVVSKYIGETEKNLNKIFNEITSGSSILFFDEADALFGKRSEVKDAHDRYANIEINYLLQKIEEHEGVVILATNFSQNIDEAFLRRIHFSVEFPFPGDNERRLIWEKIFPENAPVSENIDYPFLSMNIKLAGGNIKNIALGAAFLAAEEKSNIEMRHLLHMTKREYEKLGKPFIKSDFEKYIELVN